MSTITPLMKQYFSIKEKYQDSFVFFQVGDFFELFFEDAKKASGLLSITLTKRGYHNDQDIPLCGVPQHMVETHALKLVKLGHTVVICGQVEVAQTGKLVARAVTQVLSPGTLTNDNGIDENEKSLIYFISAEGENVYIFIFEYITFTIEFVNYKNDKNFKDKLLTLFSKRKSKEIYLLDFENKEIEKIINEYCLNFKNIDFDFEVKDDLKKTWIEKYKIDLIYKNILEYFLQYLTKYQFLNLNSDAKYVSYEGNKYLFFDLATQKHLEIIENNFDGTTKNTLFFILNKTATSMGARLLKFWLTNPLQDIVEIKLRQECIQEFLFNWHISKNINKLLFEIGDFERLAGRINLKKTNYKDYQKLIQILPLIEKIKNIFSYFKNNELFKKISSNLFIDTDLLKYLQDRIFIDYGNNNFENLIKSDSDEILKNLYLCMNSQNEIILNFEREENKKIGVENYLKIKNTPLYGYVFEISKIKDNIVELPKDYICIQTLSQKERYSTTRLKVLENDFLNAQQNYKNREKELYNELQEKIYSYKDRLIETAKALAELDVLISLTFAAQEYNWIRPLIDENNCEINIVEGKHPVLNLLNSKFIENSLYLSEKKTKSWVITGPNMGGKSTFMRQNALIVILAHIGSFVPAKKAEIPILNSIYTRIGASDNVSLGKSTFFIEMEEAAKICNNSDEKSLVILDEIGRGTSTYDGIALAASILQFLCKNKKPYLLFATHYHELYNLLKDELFISWFNVTINKNSKNKIEISYLIKEGISFDSMGIEMAIFVGMNENIINCAKNYKKNLENLFLKNDQLEKIKNLNIFEENQDLVKENIEFEKANKFIAAIKSCDLNDLSPKKAHDLLCEIQKEF